MKIPKGWRILRKTELLRRNDKYWNGIAQEWERSKGVRWPVTELAVYIRRTKKGKKK